MTKTGKIITAIGISFLVALSLLAYNLKQSGRDLGIFMYGNKASETGIFIFDIAATDSVRIYQDGDSIVIEKPEGTSRKPFPADIPFDRQAFAVKVTLSRAFVFDLIPGEWYSVFEQDSLWQAQHGEPGGVWRLEIYEGLDPGSSPIFVIDADGDEIEVPVKDVN